MILTQHYLEAFFWVPGISLYLFSSEARKKKKKKALTAQHISFVACSKALTSLHQCPHL